MEKYKYKCGNEACGHIFVAEHPNSCPRCNCDDFIIIGESRAIKIRILIGILIVSLIGIGWYFIGHTVDGSQVRPHFLFSHMTSSRFKLQ